MTIYGWPRCILSPPAFVYTVGEEVIFMFPCAGIGLGSWWMVPVMMVVMLVFCFFLMRKMPGMGCCMGGKHQRS